MSMEESEAFHIEWSIENFKMCPLPKICTPPFHVGLLRGTRWRLILYPKGHTTRNRTVLYLQREHSDNEIDEIFVDFELSLQGSGDLPKISQSFQNIRFSVNDVCGLSEIPECPPVERIVLFCILRESDAENNIWSSKKDSEFLSTELHALFWNNLFADIHFTCEDRVFHIHKAILAARCPRFLAYLENEIQIRLPEMINISNIISAHSLDLMLSYIYSGKLVLTPNDIPSDLYTIADRFGVFDLCQTMKSFSDSCTVNTNFKAQRHHLIWWVIKQRFFKPLVRIIRTGTNSNRDLFISIDARKNGRGFETICMEFQLRGFPRNANICVVLKAIVKDTKNHHFTEISGIHLLSDGEKWPLYSNAQISKVLPKKFILDCNIDICDGKNSSIMGNSMSTKLFSNLTQLSNDMMQLLEKEYNSDFILKVENEQIIRVHRAILASRCPMFSGMLTNETMESTSGIASLDSVPLTVMKQLLSYLYAGRLEELTFEDCIDLYETAHRFLLDTLKEKCSSLFALFEDKDVNLIRQLGDVFDDKYLKEVYGT